MSRIKHTGFAMEIRAGFLVVGIPIRDHFLPLGKLLWVSLEDRIIEGYELLHMFGGLLKCFNQTAKKEVAYVKQIS